VPVASNKSGVAIAYDSSGTAIDLSGSVSGVYSSIAIGTQPAHGSVTIAGTIATYIPNKGYFGADSFAFTATGPGGTSSAATVGVEVATPPAPIAKSGAGTVASSSQAQKSVDINLSALVTGTYTSIELAGSPAHGTVTIHGAQGTLSASVVGSPMVIATYAPANGFAGTDTFNFVAVGPGGRSAPATVTITVTGTVPTAAAKTAKAIDNQTVSIELTDGATEGPFTAAAVVSVSPADKATTRIVEGGSATAHTYRLDVTPAPHFGGTLVVTYTLSNQFGTSAPATVTIAVTARPDPSLDPNVRALSDAQAESTRRFAQAQSRNFLQRAEQLHNGGGSGKARMGISLGLTDMTRAGSPGYAMGQQEEQDIADRSRSGTSDRAKGETDAGKSSFSGGNSRGDGERRTGSIAIWSGGQIEIGTRDQTADRDKISVTSGGVSGGADLKLSEAATVGIGGGVGFDSSRIGGQAASLRGDSSVVAAYGSLAPAKNMFVDMVVGYGDLSFRSRRATNGATASGSRDGSMWFGAASAGVDRIDGDLRWSLYGRGEWLKGTLGAYTESGADIWDLRFDERDVSSLTGVLGGRFELNEKLAIGSFRPRVRVEWSHEFQDSSVQMLDYADIPGNALYGIRTEGWDRDQYEVAFGGGLYTLSRWVFDLELGLRGASGERDGRLTVKISKEF
jgi:large repetitive protein